jgi:hypothetical protein
VHGELRRLAIDMPRETGRPLAINEMSLAALKDKSVRFRHRRTMRITRTLPRNAFAKLEARGRTTTVGSGKATWRGLVEWR